jgi:GGDEF domain-containing protein
MPAHRARRPPRARPVADAPVDALVEDAEGIARDWLVELVGSSPLAAAPALPVDRLSASGPALCAAAARALASEADFERLEPGGDLRGLAALPAGDDAATALVAVEALRRALWAAALAALTRPPAELVADLSARLSAVCAEIAAAAVAAPAGEDAYVEAMRGGERAQPPRADPPVDPLADAADTLAESLADAERAAPAAAPIVRPPLDDQQAVEDDATPRVADGDPRSHLAARTAEFLADGRPFAVLVVELDGIQSLLAADQDGEVAAAVAAAEESLEDLVRPGDAIRRESPGRLWLTLPGAGPAGARALALRAAAAVERAAAHRGTPLTASVGLAVCPSDGSEADALLETAETALLVAQAAGTGGGPPPAV